MVVVVDLVVFMSSFCANSSGWAVSYHSLYSYRRYGNWSSLLIGCFHELFLCKSFIIVCTLDVIEGMAIGRRCCLVVFMSSFYASPLDSDLPDLFTYSCPILNPSNIREKSK